MDNVIKRKPLKMLIALIVVLTAIQPTLMGCDGGLNVSGTVVEWVDASVSESIIYVDEPIELTGMQLKPLPDITVAFDTKDYNKTWLRPSPVTDSNGKFSGGWVYSPNKELIHVTVDQDRYYPVTEEFYNYVNGSANHTFLILLVRKPS
jgi:hypothetical protein